MTDRLIAVMTLAEIQETLEEARQEIQELRTLICRMHSTLVKEGPEPPLFAQDAKDPIEWDRALEWSSASLEEIPIYPTEPGQVPPIPVR